MHFIDSHAHLDDRRYHGDRANVIANAVAQGVRHIISDGCDVPSSRAAVRLAAEHPGVVFATVGLHPHEAKTASEAALAEIAGLAKSPGVVAIGELGLDYYYNHSTPEQQRAALRAQLALARELDLPVVVHDRDTHEDIIAILREAGPGLRGMLHCFSGDAALAAAARALGFHISFSGTVTFKNAEPLRAAARTVPLESILIETDCPYLTPLPYRGRRNEPAYVPFVAGCLAELHGVDVATVARHSTNNAIDLFRLPVPRLEE